jgi:hypothetical protein
LLVFVFAFVSEGEAGCGGIGFFISSCRKYTGCGCRSLAKYPGCRSLDT